MVVLLPGYFKSYGNLAVSTNRMPYSSCDVKRFANAVIAVNGLKVASLSCTPCLLCERTAVAMCTRKRPQNDYYLTLTDPYKVRSLAS